MSKNQQRPHVGPAVGLIAGISSVTQTQNDRFLLSFLPPRMGPMGIMRIMGLIFPLPRFLVLFLHPTVGVTGLEPVTLRLSSACSNQLSYTPVGWLKSGPPPFSGRPPFFSPVEAWGFEPQTYSLQSYRSTN